MARAGVTLFIQAQVLAAESGFIAARAKTDDPASLAEIAAMVRRGCTVPEDAEKCTDGEMQAAYMGVMKAVNSAGN